MTPWVIAVAAVWVVGGAIAGVCAGVHEARQEAIRKARGRSGGYDDENGPVGNMVVVWVFFPLMVLGAALYGLHWLASRGIERVARVDRNPEVVKARLEAMERDVGLDE